MRKFLRELAWEMYVRSIDSMNPEDVIGILAKFVPTTSETSLAELADVAVVNAPELTRGEETGFEFVHKSFAEFLTAEYLAEKIDRCVHRVPAYGEGDETWHMSPHEAARVLASHLGLRPLPSEVQDMLEPMLGGFWRFTKGHNVDEVPPADVSRCALGFVAERLQALYFSALDGNQLISVFEAGRERTSWIRPLDYYANYLFGIVSLGVAAARRLGAVTGESVCFELDDANAGFWRFVAILQAGGILLDAEIAKRVLSGATIAIASKPVRDEQYLPISNRVLHHLDGYQGRLHDHMEMLVLETALNDVARWLVSDEPFRERNFWNFRRGPDHQWRETARLAQLMVHSGICQPGLMALVRDLDSLLRATEFGRIDATVELRRALHLYSQRLASDERRRSSYALRVLADYLRKPSAAPGEDTARRGRRNPARHS